MDDKDNVTYKQWVKTEYIMSLITKQDTYSFKATAHASYLKYSEENQNISDVVIVLHFSENYSFIVQDAV
ncbi:hypothetical protein PR048_012123 [Dryococelus australis]|uniref:Uncharacterized protein n=1 Tax=Dryococelus australis TaxID=614101 RepID=A0ABQ9HNK2_9NEOP|nr:hypothetical protein PR048_012123 [Dryococelus australis]